MVLTPNSARQLLCGKATDDRRWWMPQRRKKSWVKNEVNSGPPSDDSSTGMPKVMNARRKQSTRPWAPSWARSTIGQLE